MSWIVQRVWEWQRVWYPFAGCRRMDGCPASCADAQRLHREFSRHRVGDGPNEVGWARGCLTTVDKVPKFTGRIERNPGDCGPDGPLPLRFAEPCRFLVGGMGDVLAGGKEAWEVLEPMLAGLGKCGHVFLLPTRRSEFAVYRWGKGDAVWLGMYEAGPLMEDAAYLGKVYGIVKGEEAPRMAERMMESGARWIVCDPDGLSYDSSTCRLLRATCFGRGVPLWERRGPGGLLVGRPWRQLPAGMPGLVTVEMEGVEESTEDTESTENDGSRGGMA